MKMGRKLLLRRLYYGISMAALLLAFSFEGSHAVRSEDASVLTPSLQEVIAAPFASAVTKLEERVASLENAVGAFGESFTSQRIATAQLCVSDESGAQTCITKSELDALLRGQARVEVTARLPVTVGDVSGFPPAGAATSSAPADVQTEQTPAPAEAAGSGQQATLAVSEANITPSEEADPSPPKTEIQVVPEPAPGNGQKAEQTESSTELNVVPNQNLDDAP